MGFHPDDASVDRLEAGSPGQGFLHPADRLRRGQHAHGLRLLPDLVAKAVQDRRPGAEVTLPAWLGQTLQDEGRQLAVAFIYLSDRLTDSMEIEERMKIALARITEKVASL